ncbi:MAG: pentapeptide repeat-containing protein [Dissulfurispiraceae bacterium]
MANSNHLSILRSGVKKWNEWRLDNPNDAPNLNGADLSGVNLHAAHLSRADLSGVSLHAAHLSGADLSEADLSWANLSATNLDEANLIRANLSRAILNRAILSEAILGEANLSGANMSNANLSSANLSGANLSGANMSGAILGGAILSGANLSRATLGGAILSGANMSGAILSGANMSGAILSGANMSGAILSGANMSGAILSGAILSGTDLRKAIVYNTNLSEEDLDGVLYDPEQLAQMNLRQSAGAPPVVLSERALLNISFKKKDLSLPHLVQLTRFIEDFYDALYLFLFSQYDTINDLRNVLAGSIYHRLRNGCDGLHIRKMATSPSSLIELISLYAPALLLAAFLGQAPKELSIDIYKRLMDIVFKADEQREKEHLLTVDLLSKNSDALKGCREPGVMAAGLLWSDEKKKIRPVALLENPALLGEIIDQNKDSLSDRVPREDYFKAILFFRQEGLLTNKLKDFDLANLLEIIAEHQLLRHQLLVKDTGGFQIEIVPLLDEESQELTERPTGKEWEE